MFSMFSACTHVVSIDEGHDSTIHFVTDVGPTPRAKSLSLKHLPLRDVGQLSPTSILCYNCGLSDSAIFSSRRDSKFTSRMVEIVLYL